MKPFSKRGDRARPAREHLGQARTLFAAMRLTHWVADAGRELEAVR